MVKLDDFLKKYKEIRTVKANDKQGKLFESICFLIEQEPNNPKTTNAIEKILYHYVKINEKTETWRDETSSFYELSLLDVQSAVAEAVNKRAQTLKKIIEKQEERNQQEIINLLKFEDEIVK